MTSTVDGAPLFYVVNQHIGWLKQYILGMDESNWRDMRLRAERQLDGLSEEIGKIAAVQRCDAGSVSAAVARLRQYVSVFDGDAYADESEPNLREDIEAICAAALVSPPSEAGREMVHRTSEAPEQRSGHPAAEKDAT